MKKKRDKNTNKNGYTLVEIMIVVMIIGILTTISIISITKVRQNVRIKQAETELEMIAAAVRQLAWDTGKWPTMQDRTAIDKECWDLTTPSAGLLSNDDNLFDNDKWNGPYLAKINDDPWGNPYFFDSDYSTNGVNCVVVGSLGPNGTGRNRYNEDNLFVVIEPGK